MLASGSFLRHARQRSQSIQIIYSHAVLVPPGLPLIDRGLRELEGVGELEVNAIENSIHHFDNGRRRAPEADRGSASSMPPA